MEKTKNIDINLVKTTKYTYKKQKIYKFRDYFNKDEVRYSRQENINRMRTKFIYTS